MYACKNESMCDVILEKLKSVKNDAEIFKFKGNSILYLIIIKG